MPLLIQLGLISHLTIWSTCGKGIFYTYLEEDNERVCHVPKLSKAALIAMTNS
jgi:hypothetical protein